MARPDLMYDVIDAAQISPKGEIIDMETEKKIPKEENEEEEGKKEEKDDYGRMPGFFNFQKEEEEAKGANNVKFSENEGKKEKSPMGHTVQNLILLKKAIRELKGEWAYEINSQA